MQPCTTGQGLLPVIKTESPLETPDLTKTKPVAVDKPKSRSERRQEWWSQNKEAKSKLRNRETLEKKKEPEPQPEGPAVSARGFRSSVGSVISSRGFKSSVVKKEPGSVTVKKEPVSVEVRVKAKTRMGGAHNGKRLSASSRMDTTPSKAPKTEKAPRVKVEIKEEDTPDMSEVSLKAYGVDEASSGAHVTQRYILFVGNLPYSINKGQLESHFRKTGGVKKVRIPKEKSGAGKGFAYIEFRDRISQGIALRQNHTTLQGRKINVQHSTSESEAKKNKAEIERLKQEKATKNKEFLLGDS